LKKKKKNTQNLKHVIESTVASFFTLAGVVNKISVIIFPETKFVCRDMLHPKYRLSVGYFYSFLWTDRT